MRLGLYSIALGDWLGQGHDTCGAEKERLYERIFDYTLAAFSALTLPYTSQQ